MPFFQGCVRYACVRSAAIIAAGAVCACSGPGDSSATGPALPPGDQATSIRMDFTDGGDFYAAPFPGEQRRGPDGRVSLSGFPNPDRVHLVEEIIDLLAAESEGFGTTSGIFFALTGPIDPAGLPDLAGSLSSDATVFLMDVDPASPEMLARRPIKTGFFADGGPFGAPDMIALLPYQGVPLRPATTYAAVVLRSLLDTRGRPLGAPHSLAALLAGERPEGLSPAVTSAYFRAIERLRAAGVRPDDIAGLTVFRTGRPESRFETVLSHAVSGPIPEPSAPLELSDVFEDYCVFRSTIEMPTYQSGTPPYLTKGGAWVFDDDGRPVVQGREVAALTVTLPRRPMPPAGFPVVLTARPGLDRHDIPVPLRDMGPRRDPNVPASPGTGPALTYARAGFAGLMIDAPHTGLRNITNGDAQFLIFNIQNPPALRDNVRQSAVELALQAHIAPRLRIDASRCPGLETGGQPARLDPGAVAAFGSSMGATILPLAVAHEPRIRAAVLTGAGSSYIDNILYKEKPIATRGLAELLLGFPSHHRELTSLDPILSILQWGAEPADPPVYARRILVEPRGAEHHVLMIQGVVDRYILPPMANATALSVSLDLAGEALDAQAQELSAFDPFLGVAFLAGRGQTPYPARGNALMGGLGPRTAVMVQHAEDGIEDGHMVFFQKEGPKYQLKCFLQGFAKGLPTVPAPAKLSDPCP